MANNTYSIHRLHSIRYNDLGSWRLLREVRDNLPRERQNRNTEKFRTSARDCN